MTALPAAGYFESGITNAQAKTAQDDMLAFMRQQPGGDAENVVALAANTLTPTKGITSVDSAGGAGADTLKNIATTNLTDGQLILIRCANPAHVITVQSGAGGAGQVTLCDGANLVLDNTTKWLLLKNTGGNFEEIARSYGSDKTAARAFFGVGYGNGLAADAVSGDVAALLHGQCQLVYTDATHLTLLPKDGNCLRIAGKTCTVPAAGVAVGAAGASVFNYVYARDVNGDGVVDALELSATAYATDATAGNVGVAIKTGDNTRTLVGGAWINAGGNFTWGRGLRNVRSYFNRQRVVSQVENAGPLSSTSAGMVEVLGTLPEFVAFADDVITFHAFGEVNGSSAGAVITFCAHYDGAQFTANEQGGYVEPSSGSGGNASISIPLDASSGVTIEGHHTMGFGLGTTAGTANLNKSLVGVSIIGNR